MIMSFNKRENVKPREPRQPRQPRPKRASNLSLSKQRPRIIYNGEDRTPEPLLHPTPSSSSKSTTESTLPISKHGSRFLSRRQSFTHRDHRLPSNKSNTNFNEKKVHQYQYKTCSMDDIGYLKPGTKEGLSIRSPKSISTASTSTSSRPKEYKNTAIPWLNGSTETKLGKCIFLMLCGMYAIACIHYIHPLPITIIIL